jgi:hypothetical protein
MAMDRRKGRRKLLPLAHGACNLLLVLMAVFQASTGVVMLLRSAGL